MFDTKRALPRAFYERPTLTVARELIGTVLCSRAGEVLVAGRIVEVEAYGGADDPASHASRGPTPRSAIMFGSPGIAYVYFIYGMYHCLNVVTDCEGRAGALLIRAVEPLAGHSMMKERRGLHRSHRRVDLAGGPGRLCQAFGIEGDCNGLCLCDEDVERSRVWIGRRIDPRPKIRTTPRVGILVATRRRHRFVDAASDCLSVPLEGGGAVKGKGSSGGSRSLRAGS